MPQHYPFSAVVGSDDMALALILNVMNPGYMDELFKPGLIRLVPAFAVVMQIIGFLVIRKIVDIEV